MPIKENKNIDINEIIKETNEWRASDLGARFRPCWYSNSSSGREETLERAQAN